MQRSDEGDGAWRDPGAEGFPPAAAKVPWGGMVLYLCAVASSRLSKPGEMVVQQPESEMSNIGTVKVIGLNQRDPTRALHKLEAGG